MSRKAETVGTVRERERERELHFSNRECGFVQQSDTHTSELLEKIKKEKNRCKIYKDSNKSL